MLPLEVLEQAQTELLDWNGSGMSVMEVSHRGNGVHCRWRRKRRRICATLMAIPRNYKVLFLQGAPPPNFADRSAESDDRPESVSVLHRHGAMVEEGDR